MKATLTVLGSGTSMGVPTIGCNCRVCTSTDPHDRRTRPSILLEYDGHIVLIDTTPDFREQALREKITRLDAILYTHAHADHILGLDDVRPISFKHEGKIPLYAHAAAADSLESIFRYIFQSDYKFGGIARVEMHRFDGPIDLFGARFEPVKIIHGEAVIHGFRFGSTAYLTDFSEIPAESKEQLRGLDILFLDALRHRPHPTHSTVENSLSLVEELKPRRAFFTHISHDLPHEETNQSFPEHVRLAHDGLKLEFDIA
ncbi:MAG TPA: MBL fold metallo-hydrolase [Candidatus Angelobacter sp.]|jgi:phosphoribosyl 1,2-cyclic phosphate phosphodiesterase